MEDTESTLQGNSMEFQNNARLMEIFACSASVELSPVVKCNIPITQSRQSLKSLLKSDKPDNPNRFSRNIDEDNIGYKPSALLSNTQGHNSQFSKGQNQKLLL